MGASTLDKTGEELPKSGKGHGTGALGPSDSSDSGSDVQNAGRHGFDVDSELDEHAIEQGPDELDSDTDRAGTGERASADGDAKLKPNADILPDDLDDLNDGPALDPDAEGD
jgi:hypothetical protein